MEKLGPDNAFWADGEWIDWDSIIDPEEIKCSRLAELEREAELRQIYPNADTSLVPYYRDLLTLAEEYYGETDKHLQVYGDIGKLFGAIMYGIKLHRNYAQGSDGRLGNDFVEIKTIAPSSKSKRVKVRFKGHFSKLLVVMVDDDFQVSAKLIDRKNLRNSTGKAGWISWVNLGEMEQ